MDRVRGRLVPTTDHMVIDSELVIVDQFASVISSIQQAIARVSLRIDGQEAPHD